MAQSAESQPPVDRVVRFRGRSIDLRPFYEGFPYLGFQADLTAERLLYFHETPNGRRLHQLPLSAGQNQLDLTQGEPLGDIDWTRRGLRGMSYVPSRREYIVMADDANEERFNLFALAADTGSLRRLTDHDYVYGFGLDKTNTRVGYIARHGAHAPYRSCLRIIDLATMADRELLCDRAELTFTWTDVNFSPDGARVVIQANRANDRAHQNLVAIDLNEANPSLRMITDPARPRRNVETLRDWATNTSLVYTSDEDGFTNVYRADFPLSGSSTQLTHFREDVDSLVGFSPELMVGGLMAQTQVGAVIKRPYESELVLIEPITGAVLSRRVFDESLHPLDFARGVAFFQGQSRRQQFALEQITARPAASGGWEIVPQTRATVPTDVAARTETCIVERVQIPTFDQDPSTQQLRKLHAYLHRPRTPWPRSSERLAMIQSFYGGENRWDTNAQVLCAAGITVLSPSVRGSSGFGAEFAALNDHDLGGNEIFDLVHVARWLAARENLSERQVGVFGGSHGGYAAMRALSMPERVNGRTDRFNWGFGVSWFGFSNILTFYEHCNIPDWVLLEAGNPQSERERLFDRSPISHVDRFSAPILLLHGENDNRVPVTESRQLAAALRQARKPHRYVEFAGQGHGLKGIANQQRTWQSVFEFIAHDVDRHPRPTHAPTRRPRWLGVAALVGLFVLLALTTLWAERRRPA
ncbi:MAG: prolyl oligopeptidase family serine peptidase [Deltaproteobacteria bacterium]|nr:prolyl oligopeptidase family serine peptidase [Deltaproteobacteria bacterium]